eukprot:TRINITY_DN1060_c0_g1_i4.p1 TRINITY_DN1060_c0_g1~~TRINITY_DN1060_c0_g1_i4.p1  ORF type:complete len:426 (+),score=80.34 TRINITY_DN1060_c0_g1_i4:56-1333(+)
MPKPANRGGRAKPGGDQTKGETPEESRKQIKNTSIFTTLVLPCLLLFVVGLAYRIWPSAALTGPQTDLQKWIPPPPPPTPRYEFWPETAKQNSNFLPRDHAFALLNKPPDFYDYKNHHVKYGQVSEYKLGEFIGSGAFGETFIATKVPKHNQKHDKNEKFAIKVLRHAIYWPRELKLLLALSGVKNVIKVVDVLQNEKKEPMIVMPFVEADDWKKLYRNLSDLEARYYLREILLILEAAHKEGIMSRDVKPHNFLIRNASREVTSIDWGTGEFYFAGKEYSCRVATWGYKPPELYAMIRNYHFAVDLWGVGSVLSFMMFGYNIFHCEEDTNEGCIKSIAKIFGTKNVLDWAAKYGHRVRIDLKTTLAGNNHQIKTWESLIGDQANKKVINAESLDLLNRLLVLEAQDRLTAREALSHPYFLPVSH